MQFENVGDSGIEESVVGCLSSLNSPSPSTTPGHSSTTQKSTIQTPTYRSGRNREVLNLLQKMNSTLNSLVEITKKLAAEGGVKKEDDPKYMVSIFLLNNLKSLS